MHLLPHVSPSTYLEKQFCLLRRFPIFVWVLGDHVHDHCFERVAGDAVHGVVGVTKELKIFFISLADKYFMNLDITFSSFISGFTYSFFAPFKMFFS